jgi:hypothetical protein
MLSPKVIEVRRGSAHCDAVRAAKPPSARGAEVRLLSAVPAVFSAHPRTPEQFVVARAA